MAETLLKGIPASPGVVIGKVFPLTREKVSIQKITIDEDRLAQELERFDKALEKTRQEISELRQRVAEMLDEQHAHILDAHMLVLEDALLIEETKKKVQTEKVNIEYAFAEVIEKLAQSFSAMDDGYLRERAVDIRDVGRRVLGNLLGKGEEDLSHLAEEVIVVAHDLSPSDTAGMRKERVVGFATDMGSRTSHTAIIARSLEIPAVVGLGDVSKRVRRGQTIIVDGNQGVVILDPTPETIEQYTTRRERIIAIERELEKLRDLPAVTLDGHSVRLAANIELPEELPSVKAHGAAGIGLYRTEFLYLNREDLPSEDEQYHAYRYVVEQMAPHEVIIRTMDLGGDKFVSQLDVPPEMNPFLGWRAIRFCLERPDIFKTQLRAILRASAHGKLYIMFPLISTLEELRRAKELLEEAKEELRQRGEVFDEDIKVGAMIETPSAAMIADILAREVDYFSIGTNDLIQYALAVDRVNEKIAHLYDPAHPAVLRLIRMVVEAGHKEGIWVGMCGEMAGEPHFAFLLLGLGLDEFSMSAVSIPRTKKLIRSVTLEDAKRLAEELFDYPTGKEVEARLRQYVQEAVPGIFEY